MPDANIVFLLFAFFGALWPPGQVDAELNFTHNLIHGDDENGFALPDEDVTVQCTFKDDQLDSYVAIHIPGVITCLICYVDGEDGNNGCVGKVEPHCVHDDDGLFNATLVVFSGNTFGDYSCESQSSTKVLTISQLYPVESIRIDLAEEDAPIITPDGTLKLECTTNCPVAPDPLFEWSGQTQSENATAVKLPCVNQPQDTVVVSQLTIGWQQMNNLQNNITYECCETVWNLCDTLNITHAAVEATEVIIESDRETQLYQDEYVILNCTTDCPLAPLPELKWINQTDDNMEIVECGRDVRYLSVVTHLNVSWTEPEDGKEIIQYICCTKSICTNISVTLMSGSPPTSTVSESTATSEPMLPEDPPEPSSCPTGCAVGAAVAAAVSAMTIVILVCCCCERCPCYTWCRHPKPDATLPSTEMISRPVNVNVTG